MSSSALPQHNASEKAAAAAGPRCRAASRLRFCCAVLLLVLLGRAALPALFAESHAPLAAATCPQPAPWQDSAPLGPAPPPLALAKLLSGAVQINTSVFDGTPPVAEAPARWNATFAPFEAYLRRAFPLLHTSGAVQLEHINTHGLLYTYQGSDAALKPIVFTAHQDVVPVDASSEARWTHAPFSGLIDEKLGLVWGRGSSDDKASLIMLLAALEGLAADEAFTPKRTIILAFGFDEESAGTQGALELSRFLEQRYGRDSVFMLVDEGEGFTDASVYGEVFAAPAISESGYLDVSLSVRTPGGHSSSPPTHTGIGHLARLIVALENDPPMPELYLVEDGAEHDSPALTALLCVRDMPKMKHSKLGRALEELVQARKALSQRSTPKLQRLTMLLKKHKCPRARLEQARKDVLSSLSKEEAESFRTTQAVDLISGGVKINALPELATAVINYRIDASSSVAALRHRVASVLRPHVERAGLELDAWSGADDEATAREKSWKGTVVLRDAFGSALEPSPLTPTGEDLAWRVFAGTIRSTWQLDGEGIRVVGSQMIGNTDTKSYWALTRAIFRVSPSSLLPNLAPHGDNNVHTVDESTQIDALAKAHEWYSRLMRAVQDVRE